MEGAARTSPPPERRQSLLALDEGRPSPFSQQWVTITKQEHIDLACRASYWEAQHARAKSEIEKLKQEAILKDAKIKDLQNRLFGKKSEKHSPLKSEKDGKEDTPSKRKRGQQPGSQGHGRTKRPDLPIVHDERDRAGRRNAVQPVDSLICPPRRWTAQRCDRGLGEGACAPHSTHGLYP